VKLRRRRRNDELARARSELERHRRFTDAVFDSVDVGLVLLDEHGKYQTINKRHQDFMELAFPQGHGGVAGQVGLVYAEDGVRLLEHDEMPSLRAARGEEYDDVRMWVGSDPRTRRAISVSARAVRDDDGNFKGAALAYKDVTDYLRAIGAKDQFIATVSHEFRTPLTSIHGYISMMLEEQDELSEETVGYLRVVARNTDRLHRLVSDLLLSATHENQPVDIVRSMTDISELLRASVESARLTAQHAGVSVAVTTPAYVCVMADPQRFAQMVDNLVSNAVKYTLPGGRVEVVLTPYDDRVELSVSDTGIGISAADRERLFTRFFRSRDAEDRSIQGVGLGLSIVKQIVESHGGHVVVESTPGVGSTFTVSLPTDTLVVSDAPGPRQSSAGSAGR
jgi:signal transduction histidine kinase